MSYGREMYSDFFYGWMGSLLKVRCYILTLNLAIPYLMLDGRLQWLIKPPKTNRTKRTDNRLGRPKGMMGRGNFEGAEGYEQGDRQEDGCE